MQIHDLPDGFKPMIEALASEVGEVISVETTSNDFARNFYRVRIWIDVTKPLKNVISIIRGGRRQIFLVKFEWLPDWCAFCGTIGHLSSEHGDSIHSLSSLVFKDLKLNGE
jgi:hypothetical protein